MSNEGTEEYKDVSFILGLKVLPGKENEIRGESGKFPEIFKSFKSLGQFDVILLIKDAGDMKSLIKKIKSIKNVLEVFFIELE